jgi:hypothetical protein
VNHNEPNYSTSEEILVEYVYNGLRGIKSYQGSGNQPVKAFVELHRRYKEYYQKSLKQHRCDLWIDRLITIGISIATALATIYLSK